MEIQLQYNRKKSQLAERLTLIGIPLYYKGLSLDLHVRFFVTKAITANHGKQSMEAPLQCPFTDELNLYRNYNRQITKLG